MERDWQTKTVILAGGTSTAKFPLANCYPKFTFPLADGEPVLSHLLYHLKKSGIRDVAVVTSDSHNHHVDDRSVDSNGLDISWIVDDGLRGSAGALRPLEDFVGRAPFLVLDASVLLDGVDLSSIMAAHETHKPSVTVVVEDVRDDQAADSVELNGMGTILNDQQIHDLHKNSGAMLSSGLYVFDPCVLREMDDDGYCDLKEQLLPALHRSGRLMRSHRVAKPVGRIASFGDYMQITRHGLLNGLADQPSIRRTKDQIHDRVWIGRNVEISPQACLRGPLVIGNDCRIDAGARIIGPSIICDGTHVGQHALVQESMVWRRCRIDRRARVEKSVLGNECSVPKGTSIQHSVVVKNAKAAARLAAVRPGSNRHERLWVDQRGRLQPPHYPVIARTLHDTCKRVVDFVVSLVGLLLCAPLFALIAAVIKLESTGPVVYVQQRCGKGGEPFNFYKFRTMVHNAEQMQNRLKSSSDVSGPMFKMNDDPRVTRIGRFLRATSMDELPQLFNVLKGDMSLVGPRPLVMEEMKCCPRWRDIRLKVRPGITGAWQVYGRDSKAFEDWIKHDTSYVQHSTFLLDLRILARTVIALFQ